MLERDETDPPIDDEALVGMFRTVIGDNQAGEWRRIRARRAGGLA